MRSVALIIPVYNHYAQVGKVIKEALKLELPVIVVNDGSTDSTTEVLEKIPGITLLQHEQNRGKGAAILTALREAERQKYKVAITIDGDGQHKPEDVPGLYEAMDNDAGCIIVGCRQGMEDCDNVPWTSRFGRKFSNFWVWVSGGPWLQDSQSGFRLYPVNEVLNLDIIARRYQFEVEVLVKAKQQGITIKEAPVQVVYQAKGERISHFQPGRDFWRNSVVFNRLIWARLFGMFRK
jgi:glycosyltransferase involved in cell wall biosynthesis